MEEREGKRNGNLGVRDATETRTKKSRVGKNNKDEYSGEGRKSQRGPTGGRKDTLCQHEGATSPGKASSEKSRHMGQKKQWTKCRNVAVRSEKDGEKEVNPRVTRNSKKKEELVQAACEG